jgi:sentrin-specific protease 1
MEARVAKIMNRKTTGPDDVVAAGFDIEVRGANIQTLGPTAWLDDEVINFYGALIQQRSERTAELPRVLWINTFFYPLLNGRRGYQYERVRKWTKACDIFDYDKILVPIHLGNHWCLAVVDMR